MDGSFQIVKEPLTRSEDDKGKIRFSLCRLPAPGGGADRDRTGDPLLAKQVLSQLSYSPLSCLAIRMAALRRHAVGASPAERHSAREPAIAIRRLPLESPAEAKPDSKVVGLGKI